MVIFRFIFAFTLSLSVAIGIWLFIPTIHPIFSQLTLCGLIPSIVAGLFGGFIAAFYSPKNKFIFSCGLGVFLAIILLSTTNLFSNKLSVGRNPLLWYWPLWCPVSFTIGGFLGAGYGQRKTA